VCEYMCVRKFVFEYICVNVFIIIIIVNLLLLLFIIIIYYYYD